MNTVILPSGETVPALGMGTWNIGDDRAARAEEIATLQLGVSLGLKVIDTAEMYGEGKSETLIGEAISGLRDEVFLVSKVYPHNASRREAIAACERSLKRLRTDCIDLYLLHWRGSVPLHETLEAFTRLQRDGKIRHFGVSNFDVDDMQELLGEAEGKAVATNQVLYNLARRGIEWDLLPWCRDHGIPLMAYSPIEQARLVAEKRLVDFAQSHAMTPAQVALGWLLSKDNVMIIPKTANRNRLRENMRALQHPLSAGQLAELDVLFPPPTKAQPLEML
ncbi:aldo/keto reductase [Uliginosibacterium sp. H3]|uniref:Aldo/keto reductase n=1 Tax=Uliginosibacterium silvisoli TaxID=3114758 RepID=A0ABU6K0D7_9RHOO|nr:aldo/keto reductase [Uliginosibacterium sp. H3]